MTDTPRKTLEHQPWQIHVKGAHPLTSEEAAQTYESLTKCEAACKLLALAHHGTTFRPVKYGRPFLAVKEERVVLK